MFRIPFARLLGRRSEDFALQRNPDEHKYPWRRPLKKRTPKNPEYKAATTPPAPAASAPSTPSDKSDTPTTSDPSHPSNPSYMPESSTPSNVSDNSTTTNPFPPTPATSAADHRPSAVDHRPPAAHVEQLETSAASGESKDAKPSEPSPRGRGQGEGELPLSAAANIPSGIRHPESGITPPPGLSAVALAKAEN